MIVNKIDIETGRYICPVNVGDMPPEDAAALSPAYIVTPIPEGMTPERWDGTAWEGKAPEPPVEEVVVVTQPAPEERLAALEAAMLDMILGGASQ